MDAEEEIVYSSDKASEGEFLVESKSD